MLQYLKFLHKKSSHRTHSGEEYTLTFDIAIYVEIRKQSVRSFKLFIMYVSYFVKSIGQRNKK